MPRKVTISIDVVVDLNDGVDPNDVAFDIPVEQIIPVSIKAPRQPVGKVHSYCTQEYIE